MSVIDLEEFCSAVLRSRFPSHSWGRISARFYPYIGLTHTIRRSGNSWKLRISDHCIDAPRDVLEAVVVLLACRVLRRRPPPALAECYRDFRNSPATRCRLQQRRRSRGQKRMNDSAGSFHSLRRIFDDLNRRYFDGRVPIRSLGWGSRPAWVRLGHYDPVHETITLSPVLDSPQVPEAVVGFVVYHEMLHALFDLRDAGVRHRRHHSAFRRIEQAYPQYEAVRRFLAEFCGRRGRNVSRGRA